MAQNKNNVTDLLFALKAFISISKATLLLSNSKIVLSSFVFQLKSSGKVDIPEQSYNVDHE